MVDARGNSPDPRSVPAGRADRRRRDGHRLAGPGRDARPDGGDQGTPASPRPRRAPHRRGEEPRDARSADRRPPQHSHAITVFAVLEEEDRPWLVMEYLPSKKAGRLSPLLLRMLATEPAERPSMDEVERELRALLPDAEPGASVLAETVPEAEPAAMPTVPATVTVPPAPEVAPVTPGARKGLIAVGVGAALLCVAV